MDPRDATPAAAPYAQPAEHLGDEIALTRLLLARAMAGKRTDARVPDGPSVAELDAAIAGLTRTIALRLAAARAAGRPMPLDRLRSVFGLSTSEQRVVAALAALEMDVELRELARFITGDPSRAQPDVGLLQLLLYDGVAPRALSDLRPDGLLFRFALILDVDAGRDVAFVLRRVRVAERVLELAHGFDRFDRLLADVCELDKGGAPLAAIAAQAGPRVEIERLLAAAVSEAAAGRAHPAVVVIGPEGAGRKSLVAAAATALGRPVLRIRCERLPTDGALLAGLGRAIVREAMWWGALLLFDGADRVAAAARELGIDRTLLGDVAGPIAATSARLTGATLPFDRGAVQIHVELPDEDDRAILWRLGLGAGTAAEVITWSAARYSLTPGRILAASASARATAGARVAAGEAASLTRADVHAAVRTVLDSKLSGLGMRVTWRQGWSDVVLPEDTMLEIRELIARVAHRRRVHDEWGFAAKVAKGLGLSALFSGPPGTGKTMVAGIIADELGLDLYQVDLSRIVSKWVGETEKNLAELFDAAEAGHAILLFDEADSLFAKRTDVSSSVDRYANLEVNYLLQRMEAFRGISILTTNHDTAIDEAFRRRLSCKIDFPMPEVEERLSLWRTLLPAGAIGEAPLDLERMADRYVMTGGHIRNAVLRAAFLAADEGVKIEMKHLVRAANLEYAAVGKVMA